MKLIVPFLFAGLSSTVSAFVATSPSPSAPSILSTQRVPTRLFEAAEAAAADATDVEEEEDAVVYRGAQEISALTKGTETVFTSEDIDKLLPHRYPFALVDKVIEYEAGKRAVGVKCVTKNEEFFEGHFPDRPIMPGVLQVEALAQLAGIISLQMDGAEPGAVFFFAGVDGVKWKKPVVPGDTLVMEVEINKWNKRFGLCKASGRSYVNGEIVVEVGEMTFALAK